MSSWIEMCHSKSGFGYCRNPKRVAWNHLRFKCWLSHCARSCFVCVEFVLFLCSLPWAVRTACSDMQRSRKAGAALRAAECFSFLKGRSAARNMRREPEQLTALTYIVMFSEVGSGRDVTWPPSSVPPPQRPQKARLPPSLLFCK